MGRARFIVLLLVAAFLGGSLAGGLLLAAGRVVLRPATAVVLGPGVTIPTVAPSVTPSPTPAPTPSPSPSPTAAPTPSPSPSPTAVIARGADPFSAVVGVAARSGPAVVTIAATTTGRFGFQATGTGSGMIFDASGLILTNSHVVANADTISVQLADGRTFDGQVAFDDPAHDLAVVRIAASRLPTVTLGSSAGLQVGQLVVAIGNPLGTFSGSVTMGILSATGRSITVRDSLTGQARQLSDLLQVDAPINPGNSGGPLLNAAGQVVGVVTATESGAAGLAFAIPIDAAVSIMSRARGVHGPGAFTAAAISAA